MRSAVVLALVLCAAVCVSAGTRPISSAPNASAPLDSYCGGNCPSGDCVDGCPCGESANPIDPVAFCQLYSDWSQECCQCIVNAESSGNANAMNENNDGSFDVGVWQVNTQNWASCNGGNPPCDPTVNGACAHLVWGWGGGTWKLWSTCGGCGCCSSP